MRILTDRSIIEGYFEDHSGLRGGTAERVVIPSSEKEISAILRDMAEARTPVTVAGAGTGVTGGRVPFGGTVLSLGAMDRVLDIRPHGGGAVAVVQPGVSVDALKDAAASQGFMYPPDPTERSSWIGGNVATNASGSRGYKYGATRRYVERLRVILSSGEIIDVRRGDQRARNGILRIGDVALRVPGYHLPDIKNAAGYYAATDMDLIDLFIGQEGTLGVISEIEVRLLPIRQHHIAGIAFFEDEPSSWGFVNLARPAIDALSFEYFDRHALSLLRDDYATIPSGSRAAIYFEQDVTDLRDPATAMEQWSDLVVKSGARIEDVWFSDNAHEQDAFREFRHRLPEKINQIVKRNGLPKVGTDLAVPPEAFHDMMRAYHEAFERAGMQFLIFGHIGECHLHANILPSSQEEFVRARSVYLDLVRTAVRLGGTVSAEHGIGKLKHVFLEAMIGKEGLQEIARVKRTLDPSNILGRGTLIPAELLG